MAHQIGIATQTCKYDYCACARCALNRENRPMAPKGKERTRGKREIHRDNLETLSFYLIFSLVGTAFQVLHLLYFHSIAGTTTWWDAFFAVFGPGVHGLCRWVLVRLARPHLGPGGELLEAGADLSDNYISEYVVDFIIVTAFLQGLSFFTNLVWLLWLLVPGVIVYKVWRLLIWPWISQGSPTNEDGSGGGGKKQRNRVKYLKR